VPTDDVATLTVASFVAFGAAVAFGGGVVRLGFVIIGAFGPAVGFVIDVSCGCIRLGFVGTVGGSDRPGGGGRRGGRRCRRIRRTACRGI
jgi:hypothetical protein